MTKSITASEQHEATTTASSRVAETAQAVTTTAAERSRAHAEVESIRTAARTGVVDPSAWNEATARLEMAALQHDHAQRDHADAVAAHRAELDQALLDQVRPTITALDDRVVDALAGLQDAAQAVTDAAEERRRGIAHLVGQLTGTVDRSMTDRLVQGPAGLTVDGHPIRTDMATIGTSVLGAVAPLIRTLLPALGDRLGTEARVGNRFRPTYPKDN